MIAPVSVCHQVSTIGVRSPPMTRRYHIHASGLIGSPTQPSTRSEDRSKPAGTDSPHFMKVRIAVGAVYRIVTPYFCDDLPPAALVRGVRGALVDHLGRAVGQRAVDDVAVPGDPADVGGAPEHVGLRLEVEDVEVGERGLGEVAAGGVEDALRLPGGARGVEDEQRVLGLDRDRLVHVGRGASASCHHTSRPWVHATSWPVRRTTSTWWTGEAGASPIGPSASAAPPSASSTAGLRALGLPRR